MPVSPRSIKDAAFQIFAISGAGSLPIVMPHDDSSGIDMCAFKSESLI